MKKIALVALLSLGILQGPALAEMVKGSFIAPNGIEIGTHSDDFAARYEYSAPSIKFRIEGARIDSIAFLSRVKTSGVLSDIKLSVLATYSGEWHRYNQAIFKGGERARFREGSRQVLSCRYGCSYVESFEVDITPAQLAKYAEPDGYIPIQIDAQSASGTIVRVPVSHFEALKTVK